MSPCAFCRLIAYRGTSYNDGMLSSSTTYAADAPIFAKHPNSVRPLSRGASITIHNPVLRRPVDESRPVETLVPIMAVVLAAFLIIGLALPVLPLYVHQALGLGTFVVGLVAGSQFAASLFSRVWSGNYADSQGAKRAVVVGLLTATT